MSAALMRRCPKCTVPYLKSDGCNYIICAQCHTGSCYVCQQICPKNQEHYDLEYRQPGVPLPAVPTNGKCPLYDYDNSRAVDQKNVEDARKAAAIRAIAYNPNINQADIDKLK